MPLKKKKSQVRSTGPGIKSDGLDKKELVSQHTKIMIIRVSAKMQVYESCERNFIVPTASAQKVLVSINSRRKY